MPAQENPVGPRIVAGIDGSQSSASALRWAIRQADLTVSGMAVGSLEPGYGPFQESAEKIAADAISSTLDPASDVQVRARVVQGHAAQVLLDASADASLLVVGSRGHGGFAEALLGSVCQHCVQHALCPVVVVRGPDTA